MNGRALFYVQHLLGVGHLKRAAILASAMAAEGIEVTVAYGGLPFPQVRFEGVRVAQLPAATIANEDFSTLLDAGGQPVDQAWRDGRQAALLELYRATEPKTLLIELFPFGRRQFAFELIPLLQAAHAIEPRPRIACSVRDILVASRKPGRDAETIDTLRRFFDAVLVHGDPRLIPFGATFSAADQIADMIRYTGYVTEPQAAATAEGGGEVLVSAGGGAVGAPLLFAALEARPMTSLAERKWRFLTGPNLPDADFDRLRESANAQVIVERFRADFSARLRNAKLSISQAGYNTTMDILSAGIPAVVVPYETKGETEQRLRAEILAEKGLLTVVPAVELSPGRLAYAAEAALVAPRPPAGIDLSGAATTARIVRDRVIG